MHGVPPKRAHVALIRDAYADFNDRGVRAFEEIFAPHVLWLESPGSVMPIRKPRSEVMARMEFLGWNDWLIEPEDFAFFEDRVVMATRMLPRSGKPLDERTCSHYWSFRAARAERLEVHRSKAAALRAAIGHLALLERLHARLRPRTYVEIGVASGCSLGRALPSTRMIGIDPEPKISDDSLRRAAKIFALTSDRFFQLHDLNSELGGMPVDLAFIDGKHLFEYALRDFMNLEAASSERSVVVVDDCRPANREQASREEGPGGWTGDVWKLIPCLQERRPDLDVVLCGGLAVITSLSPKSTTLRESLGEIEAQYVPLEWREHAMADVRDQEWNAIEPLLPPPFDQSAPTR